MTSHCVNARERCSARSPRCSSADTFVCFVVQPRSNREGREADRGNGKATKLSLLILKRQVVRALPSEAIFRVLRGSATVQPRRPRSGSRQRQGHEDLLILKRQ